MRALRSRALLVWLSAPVIRIFFFAERVDLSFCAEGGRVCGRVRAAGVAECACDSQHVVALPSHEHLLRQLALRRQSQP